MGIELTRFGTAGETFVHPLGGILTAFAVLLMLFLPRKYVLVPLLISLIVLPLGQKIVVAGLAFFMFRIILLFGWLRVIPGGLGSKFRLNALDKALILWGLTYTVTFTLLWGERSAFVHQLGLLYSGLGTYFLLRLLLQEYEDMDRAVRVLALVCMMLSVFMVYRAADRAQPVLDLWRSSGILRNTRSADPVARTVRAFHFSW